MIKEIIIGVIILSIMFILSSGAKIQFNPFHISFSQPLFGLGIIFMVIGFMLCVNSSYMNGRKDSSYDRGFKEGIEYILNWAKKNNKES